MEKIVIVQRLRGGPYGGPYAQITVNERCVGEVASGYKLAANEFEPFIQKYVPEAEMNRVRLELRAHFGNKFGNK